MNNKEKKPTKKGLVKHVVDAGYEFVYERKDILRKVRKKGLLKIEEANHIIIHEEVVVNFKSDAAHISPVFYNLIKRKGKRQNVNPSHHFIYIFDPNKYLASIQYRDKQHK